MGESNLEPAGVLSDAVRLILSTLDRPAYMLLGLSYQLFFNVASADLFSNGTILAFYKRVQLIIGVFMMFQLAMTILKGIVEPDTFTDNKSGGMMVIKRIAISLILLTVLVPISIPGAKNEWERQINNNGLLFGALYSLQHRILDNNTLGRLILGNNSSAESFTSSDPNDKDSSLAKSSRVFTSTILKGFYRINLVDEDSRKHVEGKEDAVLNENRVCRDIPDEVREAYARLDADPGEIIGMVNITCGDTGSSKGIFSKISDIFTKLKGDNYYVFAYTGFISMIVPFVFVFILLSFTIDVAVRAVKLAVLRLIAPIPIISYMDPKGGKDGAFNSWVKTLTSTYLDLFIRLSVVYFIIFLIQDMIVNGIVINTGSGLLGIFSMILIWIGLFIFAKQAPKFIKDILGLKNDPGKLFGGFGELAAVGAAGLGVVGSAVTGWRAAGEENEAFERERKAEAMRNGTTYTPHTMRNRGRQILSTFTSGVGGAYAGGKALLGKDASMKSVVAAQNQRNAARAAHSTLSGRIASTGYGLFTGRGLSEKGNSELKYNQDAFKAFKDYKTTLEDEALKKTDFYGHDKTGSGNQYNYNKLQAAVERARSSGAATFDYNDGVHSYTGLSTDAFDVNTMNDIKSSQAESYATRLMSDTAFRADNGTAWNSYLTAQQAANNADNTTFDGNYGSTKKAMGEVKGKATAAETDMRTIMRRANDQNKK